MALFFDTGHLPGFKNAVVTIGTFDGVHLGHQKILQTVIDEARAVQGESMVITFDPHPRKLLFPEKELKILTPLQEKLALISSIGIHHIVVVPFTKEFSSLSAQQYIQDFLIGKFHPHTIVIGYDHHFGNDRKGNIRLLEKEQTVYGYKLIEIPEQVVDEASISSTKIRNALLNGNVQESAAMMGRYYRIKGTVIKGNQLGRTIGYPTANLRLLDENQLLPAIGIYCVQVRYGNFLYGGMLSIGHNPTVTQEKSIKIEVHIFEFHKEIYGEEIELVFIDKMRNEEKFSSVEELKMQLKKDEVAAREVLRLL